MGRGCWINIDEEKGRDCLCKASSTGKEKQYDFISIGQQHCSSLVVIARGQEWWWWGQLRRNMEKLLQIMCRVFMESLYVL